MKIRDDPIELLRVGTTMRYCMILYQECLI